MIGQRICLPGMRSLAAHFVQGKDKMPYIFHPCYDMRERFVDLNALQENLNSRHIHDVNLEKVAGDYNRWWDVFKTLPYFDDPGERLSHEMIRKRDEIRAELLEHEAGLLSALQLPNDLDEGERPHGGEPMSRLKSPDQWSTESEMIDAYEPTSQHLLKHRLRRSLSNLLRKIFKSNAIQVSPPSMVRPAIIEACNIDWRDFPIVTCSKDPYLSLVGVSLPTMLSFLPHHILIKSNAWPLVLFSSGAAYIRFEQSPSGFGQHDVFTLLLLAQNADELASVYARTQESLQIFLASLGSQTSFKRVDNAYNLRLYERSAITITTNETGRLLGQVSKIGDYISRRICLNVPNSPPLEDTFVHSGFVELDLTSLVSILLERNKC